MRIDAYNSVNQIYQSANAKMNAKSKTVNGSSSDKFEISDTAKNYQLAKQAIKDAPDIREDKVAEIKAKMQAGNYTVTPSDFADKLIQSSETITF